MPNSLCACERAARPASEGLQHSVDPVAARCYLALGASAFIAGIAARIGLLRRHACRDTDGRGAIRVLGREDNVRPLARRESDGGAAAHEANGAVEGFHVRERPALTVAVAHSASCKDKLDKQGSGINTNKQAINTNKQEITHRVKLCSGIGHLLANLCSLPRPQPHLSWPNQAPCEFVHLAIYFQKVSPKKRTDPNILLAQRKIEENLGLNTKIVSSKNKSGKVIIAFNSPDQFELLSKLLTSKK